MFQYEALITGCNRIPAAASWASNDILAFGAESLVAVGDPLHGINCLLSGHKTTINCVNFLQYDDALLIFSASIDGELKCWKKGGDYGYDCVFTTTLSSSINCMCIYDGIVVCGCSDGTCSVFSWDITKQELVKHTKIELENCIPMALSMIYTSSNDAKEFRLATRLLGHVDWVRCLEFYTNSNSKITLASGSQDKLIRLWSLTLQAEEDAPKDEETELGEELLMNKPFKFEHSGMNMQIVFDALLLGHEDWIMTIKWNSTGDALLSSSTDSSLIIWEADKQTGIWIIAERLGDIASSHGSTTATGSAGGFWGGLWKPDDSAVACWGRTGGWRIWVNESGEWVQKCSISGHAAPVKCVSWEPEGRYFLSTGLDQTTRLFAPLKNGEWHEMARPQIHGYDMNSLYVVSATRFISCADEKVMRVFDMPITILRFLNRICGIVLNEKSLPEAANVPLLALSNKAITSTETGTLNAEELQQPITAVIDSLNDAPLEEHLQRLTLFPEVEKLYGHGYEVYACCATKDCAILASACKSQTPDHAVIRLYETATWKQTQVLSGHSLTITTLKFSYDDKYLLSTGRDRLVCLHKRIEDSFEPYATLKSHSRIVWDASWAPSSAGYVFATGSRDKFVKFWKLDEETKSAKNVSALQFPTPVTAVDFAPFLYQDKLLFAVGTESGALFIWQCPHQDLTKWKPTKVPNELNPGKTITCLSWRPVLCDSTVQLLVASDDTSVRILNIKLTEL
ncbi:elongator complex subunit Elp2 [Schizosaccharomyces japonicus yFS275]|uniref:Elongator complex protein 2 n=1 Tax=Schizosaccharomyces japonicus (strain yFS275 / FY16936) TaxID=402676 RepID=B6K7J1_SCHJY|nr:elongator complex subunit Elp2 [Schizosaccharomyces japonicus yFS275]EEB09495.1 elongator complex subunit Elp2 [Schizosaccharomyces japonicus yFS275]